MSSWRSIDLREEQLLERALKRCVLALTLEPLEVLFGYKRQLGFKSLDPTINIEEELLPVYGRWSCGS
jgi:hypothetical protein